MKKLTTGRKIKFLQQYSMKWHKKWHKKHPENIIGFKIGKKVKTGIESRSYAIIFNVRKKLPGKELEETVRIPPYFRIRFPDGKMRKIETDVQETGSFEFHSGITAEVTSRYSGTEYGSAGLFVKDGEGRVYMISNYHVVALNMMLRDCYYYLRPAAQTAIDVTIRYNTSTLAGRFEEGRLSPDLDVAFVEVFCGANPALNSLPDGNRILGKVNTRPYATALVGREIIVYSFHNSHGKPGRISNNAYTLYTGTKGIYFKELIQISPRITQGGDSGGIVLTPSFAIAGLIIGADNQYSYAIPFYKITDFKNVNIL